MHLTAENLCVRRGEDFIFINISFNLKDGEALMLTGRNGSGKSTLLRTIAGLLHPEKGSIKLAGEGIDPETRPSEASHYLGHRNGMKTELTVSENLAFWKTYLGDFSGGSGCDVEEAARIVGLSGITHLPFGYLSAGQQRSFSMAKLLLAWRPVWILDEPTAALDTGADLMVTELVKDHLINGGIVIAAAHQPLSLNGASQLQMKGFLDMGAAW